MNECPSVFDELVLPPTYGDAFGELCLSRPLFADHDEITRFGEDLVALYDLIAALPERCYDGDLRRYCAALGMDERMAELLRLGARGGLELYGRADAYHDGDGFKLLEFNVGSELGGIDAAQMNRAFLAVPAFREFASAHRLEYVDTTEILARRLRRATASGDPVVALLEGPGGLREHHWVFDAIQEAMRAQGIELLLGEVQELSERRGKLMLHGTPLDVVLRYFTAGQLLEYPGGRRALQMMLQAHDEQATALFTPLEHGLMESKANLGLLHDLRNRAHFSADERALVDRLVPWTRTFSPELIELCRERREALILKPGTGCGGAGAVLGRECGERAWADTLRAIGDRDYVVQELVDPVAEPVVDPLTGDVQSWQANWGVFATGEGYAGAFVRALRADDGSVISYSNRETRGTCVFTYPTGGSR